MGKPSRLKVWARYGLVLIMVLGAILSGFSLAFVWTTAQMFVAVLGMELFLYFGYYLPFLALWKAVALAAALNVYRIIFGHMLKAKEEKTGEEDAE